MACLAGCWSTNCCVPFIAGLGDGRESAERGLTPSASGSSGVEERRKRKSLMVVWAKAGGHCDLPFEACS